MLHGLVNPRTRKTTYWFEVGTTLAYGTTTNPASAGKGDKPVTVTAGIGGLEPATTYHVRLVASNDRGVSTGADVTFTTPAARRRPARRRCPLPPPRRRCPGPSSRPRPPPRPCSGAAWPLAPASGTVLVRVPGRPTRRGARRRRLGAGRLDRRHPRRHREAAEPRCPAAATQTGTFHGGLFEVRQPAGGHGMTELVLRGALPTCPAGGARAAAVARRRPPRSLWGHDSHGQFRTRASNSVITVRGTTWFVSDRCDGTLTRVTSGSVAVRDLRTGRTVVVRAGQRHLARRVG